MRRVAFGFIGLAFASPAMAQGVPQTDTEAGVDVAPITEQFNIDRSDRMTVQVRVNGSAPVPFIVDTGAERTVIANDFARKLALEVRAQASRLRSVRERDRVPSLAARQISVCRVVQVRNDTLIIRGHSSNHGGAQSG